MLPTKADEFYALFGRSPTIEEVKRMIAQSRRDIDMSGLDGVYDKDSMGPPSDTIYYTVPDYRARAVSFYPQCIHVSSDHLSVGDLAI